MIPVPRGAGSTWSARIGAMTSGATFVVLTQAEVQGYNEITLEQARGVSLRGTLRPVVFDHRVVQHLEDEVDGLRKRLEVVEIERVRLHTRLQEAGRDYLKLREESEADRARRVAAEAEAARLREALLVACEWWGGCGHHPDDCPGLERECVAAKRVNELSRL